MNMKAMDGNVTHRVPLRGGRRDRQFYVLEHPKWYWPEHLYLTMPLTLEEARGLEISETMSWRWPDEVYRREPDSLGHRYVFEKVVHYCPNKGGENE